jgi:ribosomal protein S18 acetylase RimI-like enzyme
MPEPITIRRAVAADLPVLCRLSEALVHQHVAYDPGRYQPPTDVAFAYAQLFSEHIGRPTSVVEVGDRNGELVGYVFGEVVPPSLVELAGRTGWVHDLYVSPAARGLGAGGLLLDAAVARLQLLGCPGGILLSVAAQNVAAAALFRGRGFRPTLQEMTLGPWLAANGELADAESVQNVT